MFHVTSGDRNLHHVGFPWGLLACPGFLYRQVHTKKRACLSSCPKPISDYQNISNFARYSKHSAIYTHGLVCIVLLYTTLSRKLVLLQFPRHKSRRRLTVRLLHRGLFVSAGAHRSTDLNELPPIHFVALPTPN